MMLLLLRPQLRFGQQGVLSEHSSYCMQLKPILGLQDATWIFFRGTTASVAATTVEDFVPGSSALTGTENAELRDPPPNPSTAPEAQQMCLPSNLSALAPQQQFRPSKASNSGCSAGRTKHPLVRDQVCHTYKIRSEKLTIIRLQSFGNLALSGLFNNQKF